MWDASVAGWKNLEGPWPLNPKPEPCKLLATSVPRWLSRREFSSLGVLYVSVSSETVDDLGFRVSKALIADFRCCWVKGQKFDT